MRSAALTALGVLLAACGPAVQVAAPVNTRGAPLPTQATCIPTDQDQYAYRPARLQVIAACLRITGTIVSSTVEADGDVHINVRLDPDYEGVLTPENREAQGNLVVEPVCQFPAVQAEAIRVCVFETGCSFSFVV